MEGEGGEEWRSKNIKIKMHKIVNIVTEKGKHSGQVPHRNFYHVTGGPHGGIAIWFGISVFN